MDYNNENDAQGNVRHPPVSILDLPNEPFEIICSSVDTSTLMNLPLVCKKFNSYINEISLKAWKRRAKYSIWADAVYPISSPANPDKPFWRTSCAALQKQKTLCTQNAHPLIRIYSEKIRIIEAEYILSSLLLIRKHDDIVYVAAKGRNLFYRNINSTRSDICIEAHCAPITDLTNLNNEIYSCSFENENIKSWKINNGYLQMETSYNFSSDSRPSNDWPNCLSSYSGQYKFAVGSYNGYVTVFDSRLRNHVDRYPMREKNQSMIRTLAMNSEYILSADYDNEVFAYDQRKRQIINKTEIPEEVTCIKMQQDCVLIGDYLGKLHVLNPKNDFELVKSYDIGHKCEINGVHLTYGNLITSSTCKVIISSPTDPPRHMYTLNIPNITIMDYQKSTLALVNTKNQIQIYQYGR